jgi:hypothetical protein
MQDAPLVTVGLLILAHLYGLISALPILLAIYGFVVSWTYLRYFQQRDSLRGDLSEAFAFEVFWPAAVQ